MKRIKYASRFAHPLNEQDIRSLEEQCVRNNMETGITGVLMVSGSLFFQVLEGSADAVDDLFETISNDSRHQHVLIIGREDKVKERLFADWAMKVVSLDPSRTDRLEPLHAILETIVDHHHAIERLTGSLERALWNELAYGAARKDDSD